MTQLGAPNRQTTSKQHVRVLGSSFWCLDKGDKRPQNLGAADAADLPEAVDDAPWSDDTNAAVPVVPCKRVDENANMQDGGPSPRTT